MEHVRVGEVGVSEVAWGGVEGGSGARRRICVRAWVLERLGGSFGGGQILGGSSGGW